MLEKGSVLCKRIEENENINDVSRPLATKGKGNRYLHRNSLKFKKAGGRGCEVW